MKTVGIICPKCSKIIQYDCTAEKAECRYCGCPIATGIDGNDEESKQKLATAIDELHAILNEGFSDYKISDVTNRILGLDTTDGEAWFYKGLASMKVSTKLACYFNCVRYMVPEDHDGLFDEISDDISSAIYLTMETDWSPFDLAATDVMLSKNRPGNSEKNRLLLNVMNKLASILADSEDAGLFKTAMDGYAKLAVASLTAYRTLTEQREVLGIISKEIDVLIDRSKHFTIDDGKKFNVRTLSERLSLNKKFVSMISSEIDSAMAKTHPDDLEQLSAFWKDRNPENIVSPLLDAYGLNGDKYGAGMMESAKLSEIQSNAASEYVQRYLRRGKSVR